MSGFEKVDRLSSYLVSLRDSSLALSHNQANEVIRLWNNLCEYDKRPTTFSARHKTKLTQGRFKSSKRRSNTVIPSVDSTKR